ncbi:hypothetical protein [Sphingopyxis sp. YF1]|uniref:hypothetical protein n=1 Tax=Sphingopyxis sp. YF1 TaxID=2482763 RepID=UPI001F61A812|nr:hypothetical protein [Sphingopyxis sp. YF1]
MRHTIPILLATSICVGASAQALEQSEQAGQMVGALRTPIELPSAPPQKFTRNVFAGDKVRQRIFIPSYRVSFLISASASARTTDTRANVETVLSGAEPALIQAITDRAYADLVERLTAAGFSVVPQGEWSSTSGATSLKAKPGEIEIQKMSSNGARQSYALVHPTGLAAWPESAMPVNLGAVRTMTRELDATMVAPRFTVNYAYVQAKGGGSMAILSRGAQASFRPMIHGGPVIGGFSMEPWRVRVGQHGGFMEYKVDGSLEAPGDFGLVSGRGGDARATSTGGAGVDTWEGRLGYNSQLTATGRFEVDPEAYARLALQALALQNQVAVDELRKARR